MSASPDVFYNPARPPLAGSNSVLESLGHSTTFLFDLDDTMAMYDKKFIVEILFETLKDHCEILTDDQAKSGAIGLCKNMNFGDKQKEILQTHLQDDGIKCFWNSFTDRFSDKVKRKHVKFDEGLVKFINFALRNDLALGIISNSSQKAGMKILGYLEDRNDIDLSSSAIFLGSSKLRKPNPKALDIFTDTTGIKVDPNNTVYTGNSMSDLRFALNTGMTPVMIDQRDSLRASELSPAQQSLLSETVIISNFSTLKNYVERQRPHYRRPVSLSIERSFSGKQSKTLDKQPLSVNPTEDNIYRIVTEGTKLVMSHVPTILRRFHEDYQGSERFSVLDIPNYQSQFHEATGSLRLPPLDMITSPYAEYFSENRIRREGEFLFSRGPNYYRQYIPELKYKPDEQLGLIEQEIFDAIDILSSVSRSGTTLDNMLELAVEDNLRGNIQSLYISIINTMRQEKIPDDLLELKKLYVDLGHYYDLAVQLQYSHMLGLDHDKIRILEEISSVRSTFDDLSEFLRNNSRLLTFKSPEIDNPIMIGARANEICQQYPDVDILVGLSSGGVELASVTKLLIKHKSGRQVDVIHYPISVHNGLNMWSKDKDTPNNDARVGSFFGIDRAVDKNVVICEDNSNSGQTLSRVIDRFESIGANKVNFAVIEIDPTRILMHTVQQKAGAKHNIGQAASRERPVANYFYPDFVGAISVVKILPADQGMAKTIAIDTANRYVEQLI